MSLSLICGEKIMSVYLDNPEEITTTINIEMNQVNEDREKSKEELMKKWEDIPNIIKAHFLKESISNSSPPLLSTQDLTLQFSLEPHLPRWKNPRYALDQLFVDKAIRVKALDEFSKANSLQLSIDLKETVKIGLPLPFNPRAPILESFHLVTHPFMKNRCLLKKTDLTMTTLWPHLGLSAITHFNFVTAGRSLDPNRCLTDYPHWNGLHPESLESSTVSQTYSYPEVTLGHLKGFLPTLVLKQIKPRAQTKDEALTNIIKTLEQQLSEQEINELDHLLSGNSPTHSLHEKMERLDKLNNKLQIITDSSLPDELSLRNKNILEIVKNTLDHLTSSLLKKIEVYHSFRAQTTEELYDLPIPLSQMIFDYYWE